MPLQRDYTQFLTSFASSKFQSLWPAQAHVLDAYATTFLSQADVAIELPTGAGKTLIALLIAEAWRQEEKKVAILSANKTLAWQMLRESQVLGIPAVLMEGRGAFTYRFFGAVKPESAPLLVRGVSAPVCALVDARQRLTEVSSEM